MCVLQPLLFDALMSYADNACCREGRHNLDFAVPRKRKLIGSAEAPCKHLSVACSLYAGAIDQGFLWLQAKQRHGNAC